MHHRPVVIVSHATVIEPCASCGARPLSVCHAIEDKDLHRLAELALQMTVPEGKAFINEGDDADHFFNVTGGTARLTKSLPDGRRQVTGFANTGHFLGLAVSDSYGFSAEAIDTVRVCRFSRSRLRGLLDDFPALEHRLLQTASNELVAAQEQMLLLGRKTARERLASFIVNQARMGPCGAAHRHIRLPMTRGDIADYLGLTIETVSRTFSKLRIEGFIALPTPDDVEIRRPDALEEIAGGLA